MEISKKHILSLTILPAAVLLLSGCSLNPEVSKSPAAPITAQQAAPKTVTTSPSAPQATEATSVSQPLPPLPADNKAAIDSELQGIDKALQDTDAALSQDTTDGELGL